MPTPTEAAAHAETLPNTESCGAIRYALSGRVFRRNVVIALIVGTLLTLANQFDVILRGPVDAGLFAKICFNFVIPFVVSSVSAYANQCGP
jgi:hypothetical protein